MTTPWLADAPDIIKESHGHIVRATAVGPDLALPLEVEDFTVSWDDSRVPRVDGQMVVRAPDDPADIAALDPRAGVRIEIDAGYRRPGGIEDVQPLADLGLRVRSLPRPDDTLRVEVCSDEQLVIDGSPSLGFSVVGSSHVDAMTKLIKQCIHPAPRITTTLTGAAITVDPVTNRWATVQDLADRLEARAYDDGLRDWVIEKPATMPGTVRLEVAHGVDGTLVTSEHTIDREEWANYVALDYEWTDSAGADKRIKATAIVTAGRYAITGAAEKRIFLDHREVPTTQAMGNAAALAILRRMMTRAHTYTFTAIAAYWLRPGMTVKLTPPKSEARLLLVTSVTFRPLDGTMTVVARVPADLGSGEFALYSTTTPPPPIPTDPSPPPTPDPEPAPKTRYVSTWQASSSRTYKGSGGENTVMPPDIAQGYYSGTNGNQRAIVLFTGANSTGDETGKTITQALSGATLSKVEVWLYCTHTYSFAGGDARIGYYNNTSLPGTFTGGLPYITAKDWKKGTGRWVTINNANLIRDLLDGSARGILVGPGVGTDRYYYMKFSGATASSNKPKLRLTYSK